MYLFDYKSLFSPDEVLIYLRKSRSDDPALTVKEVLEKHESILDEWAVRNLGEKIPEENKFREVVSGETLKERPEINILLRMVESPKYKAVAVVEPQRLTRGDLEDIGRLMKLLKHSRTYIATPQRVYDLSDEYDWDAFERELKRGNDYLEYTKKILSRGRLLSVSQGNYIGSIAPYGHTKTWVMEGKRKCPTLKPNEEEAAVINMGLDLLIDEGWGVCRICNYFDSLKIKPPKGDYWSPDALRGILTNIHHIGKVCWNRRKTVTIVEDSIIKNIRPKAKEGDYLIFDGKHPSIVTEERFNAAKEILRKSHRARPNKELRNPLAGLLYCKCGRAMSMRTYTKQGNSPRLLCDNQTHCKTGSCLYEEMIVRVIDILEQNVNDFEIYLKSNNDESVKFHTKAIDNLNKKKKDLDSRELSLWEAQSDPNPANRMPQEIFRQLNSKLLKEKEEVQQALRAAHESMPDTAFYKEKSTRFKLALDALKNPDVSAAEKNRLLKTCFNRIEYYREPPQRIKSNAKRITVNGKKIRPDGLAVGAHWTTPPIELEIKLKT